MVHFICERQFELDECLEQPAFGTLQPAPIQSLLEVGNIGGLVRVQTALAQFRLAGRIAQPVAPDAVAGLHMVSMAPVHRG